MHLGDKIASSDSNGERHLADSPPGATDTEAPRLQGIDPATLQDLMSPDDVASMALENLRNGPTYIPSEHYRMVFDALLAMPRDDALTAMARTLQA
ncbi:hypothetical protein OG874_44400 [Nocardia sp. NBC_00565]|uniref:hypothetical protein n=1 Tax=Nocardia sp. NBC_00565 TaxID=2975993 RepID=UPI002E81F587|nr:hypothetical protein [Nocardia sp. NBC_00565]WUC03605.1 hypothetical protein OG874_44400 [Nocardia sp. NBC_00565]